MVDLSIRFLDGSTATLQPGAAWTIADVKSQLEQTHSLPSLYEFKLIQGTQELSNNTRIEIEIQAMVTKSAAKAIAKLNELMEIWKMRPNDEQSDEDKAAFKTAVEVLEECKCDHSDCEQLLALLSGMSYHFDLKQRALIATAFGRVCIDPSPTCLRNLLQLHDKVAMWCALAEISTRFQDTLPINERTEIVDSADAGIQTWLNGLGPPPEAMYFELRSQYHVLDQLDRAHLLQCKKYIAGLVQNADFSRVNPRTAVFLGHLVGDLSEGQGVEKEERSVNKEDHDGKADLPAAFPATGTACPASTSATLNPELGLELQLPGNASQTDKDLDEAMAISEAEALEQEKTDLAEALLLSSEAGTVEQENADLAEALLLRKDPLKQYATEVVVLRLTRRSEEVVSTLLDSSKLAGICERVTAAGCSVSPEWANGATLLVPLAEADVEEGMGLGQLQPYHVVAFRSDVDGIQEALLTLPKRRRSQIKFEDQSAQWANDQETCVTFGDLDISVERTFVNFPCRKQVSENSTVVQTAPCGSSFHPEPVNPRRWFP